MNFRKTAHWSGLFLVAYPPGSVGKTATSFPQSADPPDQR